jgi:hypothetical protein
MSWQPPPAPNPNQGGGNNQNQGNSGGPIGKNFKEISYYELLQVDRDAHPTIIRYAYRFLAAMYHPDNGESGDAEKFRIITEAWRTLSDEGKRAAYDMSLGAKEVKAAAPSAQGGGPSGDPSQFGKDSLPKIPKTGLSWNEIELRLAILQILLGQRKKRPQTGGATAKMMMDILSIDNVAEMEFALWYLRETNLIEMGDRMFMISWRGVDYIVDQLSKTQMLDGGGKTEQKIKKFENVGPDGGTPNLPARTR